MKKYIVIFLLTLFLVGCGKNEGADLSETVSPTKNIDTEDLSNEGNDEVLQSLNFPSYDYTKELSKSINFADGEEILITKSGTYEFTGDYNSSVITVDVDKDTDDGTVYLILNNANITSESKTPINVIEGKDVVIVLEGENTINQGEITTSDTEFPTGAIYSKADTVITGGGILTVNTKYRDGINSRDDLIIDDATITVNASEDGIVGKDLLAINNANINIICEKDGLKSSNDEDLDRGNIIIASGDFYVKAQSDAITSENEMLIGDGDFELYSGGGFVEVLNEITRGEGSGNTVFATDLLEYSMCCLKGSNIVINGGNFNLSSYEDTVHANGELHINSGNINILAGDDALHTDTDLFINSGEIVIENAYEGIEGDTITINGGNIEVVVLDDAINASSREGFVKITDGVISLKCRGDGIDSNGDLIIEGGEIVIDVDAIYVGGDSELDVTGSYTISGGTVTDENGNTVELSDFHGGPPQMHENGERPLIDPRGFEERQKK